MNEESWQITLEQFFTSRLEITDASEHPRLLASTVARNRAYLAKIHGDSVRAAMLAGKQIPLAVQREYRGLFKGECMEQIQIARDIKYNWSAGEVSFNCPCGEKDIFMDESGQTSECACGRVYRLHHYIEVEEPKSEQGASQ